ncbi:MAG TPA: FABP family protein [Kineosporiaceae bacterium]|nr:FABP family protein [Kineosporiaceae bacterium]
MPIELSADLHPKLMPVAWLIGTWAGAGVIGYPSMDSDLRFGQEVVFSHDGRPFLSYTSRTWLLDEEGNQVKPLASESGYWRVGPGDRDANDVEVLLTHPTGVVEIYIGRVDGARAELATDLVARTSTAKEYTAASRMYGLVEGDLMWVMEMAAMGHPLGPHASARLKRV